MEVLTLVGADVDRAAGVIARAFLDDPSNVHLFPDGKVRARLAPSMFAAYVRLETFSERSVPFYLRNGFEVLVEDVEATSGLQFWVLRHPGWGCRPTSALPCCP
jgi:hypothetical protein